MNAASVILAFMDNPTVELESYHPDDLVAYFLISLTCLVVLLGAACIVLVMQLSRSSRRLNLASQAVKEDTDFFPRTKFKPFLYEPPTRWMAIKSNNPQAVATVIGLHHPTRCSWEQALTSEQDHKLFVAPPVAGWVLVVGPALPDPATDIDFLYRFLIFLSRSLGQVQFFHANRIVNAHAWVYVDHARILRAYAWAGATLWNQGKLTPAESELDLKCLDYGEAGPPDFPTPDPQRRNAERVTRLAGRWSLDPTALDENVVNRKLGVSGYLWLPKPH